MANSRIEAVIWTLLYPVAEKLDSAERNAEPLVLEMLTAARAKLNEAIDWLTAASAESDTN